jgi:serine phosphatase RsbU (regulator of sigma subunit)
MTGVPMIRPCVVDPTTHSFELSNAGHMSPIIRRANGSVDKFDEDLVGPPIGVVDGYPYVCESKMLEPGDLVVLVTDGVDEWTWRSAVRRRRS